MRLRAAGAWGTCSYAAAAHYPTHFARPSRPPPLRYGRQTAELRPLFSEFALIKHRVVVEVEWLRALASCEVSARFTQAKLPSTLCVYIA